MTTTATRRLRIVYGSPWREALICAMKPDAPHRPWQALSEIQPGDVAVVVIATDPPTVLGRFTFGELPLQQAIAARFPFECALRTVDEMQQAAGGHRLSDGPELGSPAARDILGELCDYRRNAPSDSLGDSSVAAARILLASTGRCTCCARAVDLAAAAPEFSLHLVSEDDFHAGRDWPALLCRTCTDGMADGGFGSVVDYIFSLRPPCPACSARRARAEVYGEPAWPEALPPWECSGGCCVVPDGQWVCGECGHSWARR